MKKAPDKEGKAILSSVRKGAAIVAMCIEGKQISSDELAQFLAQRAGSGAGDVAFVIGSSHGLSDEVKKAAALKFSMGRITMPISWHGWCSPSRSTAPALSMRARSTASKKFYFGSRNVCVRSGSSFYRKA